MKITEVYIELMPDNGRLLAFASVTLDGCLVVHDLKVIHGPSGLFVAMPSCRLTERCTACNSKQPLTANFCGHCGKPLGFVLVKDERGKAKVFADVMHPVTQQCREMFTRSVLEAYRARVEAAEVTTDG